ncbi:hypothetical protein ASG49_16870 [Marmoricola sp. Leaf446]|uniref:general stress protein n=1 Tax=Marmoricola sp. Leaf446 TaxID=1736379 RepID=UPI0006FEC46F|nr:general stress protein [Marmoricola sp. Leaf446]KQT89432.1 hypothetical protein ASG49_16870 [Marmoricola sp. Leaf446]
MSQQQPSPRFPQSPLTLAFPMSLGVYKKYADAQRAVDHLSDHEFPVQNCLIVGTDLRQVERVTGRLTWGKVLLGGAASGLWLGVFVGLVVSLFGTGSAVPVVLSTMLFGALFGVAWAAAGYAATRGRRDFTSVSQVVATRYELLVEHKHAEQGRALLTGQDDAQQPHQPAP